MIRSLLTCRWNGWIFGAIGAAAMFGLGMFVSDALDDDNAPRSPDTVASRSGSTAARPATLATEGAANADSMAVDRAILYAECESPLGDVFEGTAIDPAKLGFDLKTPGDGYRLTGVSVRRVGECDENGKAIGGDVAVDTRWLHEETGLSVWLSQRATDEQVANILRPESAEFWHDGYAYSLGVNIYRVMPVDTMAVEDAPAVASDAGVARGSSSSSAAVARVGDPDPRGSEIVREIISALAPDLGLECFYRQSDGGWDDLAAEGLGDPRGAIPGGLSEVDVYSSTLLPPADGCNTPTPNYIDDFQFSAHFSNADTTNFVSISIHPVYPELDRGAGRLEYGSLSWSDGTHQFYVSAQLGDTAESNDVVLAVGRALDRGFDQRCILVASPIDAGELEDLGVRSPLPPDGFRIESSTATRYSVQGDCSGIEGAGEGFRATWFLYDPDIPAAVEVSAWRGFGDVWRAEPNTSTSYGYFWVDANGTGYSLTGGKGQVPEDTLVAIARSLDPTFDPANLTPVEDEVVPLPRPLPETIR